jgi:hypothetical protein
VRKALLRARRTSWNEKRREHMARARLGDLTNCTAPILLIPRVPWQALIFASSRFHSDVVPFKSPQGGSSVKSIGKSITLLLIASVVLTLTGCTGANNIAGPAPEFLDNTPPPSPSGLATVYAPQSSMTTLTWDASPAADVAHYDIYMATGDPAVDGSYVKVGQVTSASTSWNMPLTSSDTVYDCRVKAVDASSNASAFSTTLHTTVASYEAINGGGAGGTTNPGTRRLPE